MRRGKYGPRSRPLYAAFLPSLDRPLSHFKQCSGNGGFPSPIGLGTTILRKHFQSDRPLLNVSRQLLDELLRALPGFHPSLEDFCQSRTTITVPRPFLWKCFELLDLQTQQQHFITRNREKRTVAEDLAPRPLCGRDLGLAAPKLYFIMALY